MLKNFYAMIRGEQTGDTAALPHWGTIDPALAEGLSAAAVRMAQESATPYAGALKEVSGRHSELHSFVGGLIERLGLDSGAPQSIESIIAAARALPVLPSCEEASNGQALN
jgi:hypothetical protein